jgi:hypothetical protein
MAKLSRLSEDSAKFESLPDRTKRPRLALTFAVTGALSFWLPDLVIHINAGPNLDSRHAWLITTLAPAIFLLAYVVARNLAVKRNFQWVGAVMLLGVWLSGGLFMMLAGMLSGNDFMGSSGAWRLVVLFLSVIPIVTYVLAAYDGSLFALLAVTLGALVLCGARASWLLLSSPTPSCDVPRGKAALHQKSKVA